MSVVGTVFNQSLRSGESTPVGPRCRNKFLMKEIDGKEYTGRTAYELGAEQGEDKVVFEIYAYRTSRKTMHIIVKSTVDWSLDFKRFDGGQISYGNTIVNDLPAIYGPGDVNIIAEKHDQQSESALM